jgi:hypothetical protein
MMTGYLNWLQLLHFLQNHLPTLEEIFKDTIIIEFTNNNLHSKRTLNRGSEPGNNKLKIKNHKLFIFASP